MKAVWDKQRQFQYDLTKRLNDNGFETFDWDNHTEHEKQDKFKNEIFHVIDEALEAVRETNFRKHRKTLGDKKIDYDALKKELIDTQLFLLNCFLIWDVDFEEFEKLMFDTIENNRERFLEAKK